MKYFTLANPPKPGDRVEIGFVEGDGRETPVGEFTVSKINSFGHVEFSDRANVWFLNNSNGGRRTSFCRLASPDLLNPEKIPFGQLPKETKLAMVSAQLDGKTIEYWESLRHEWAASIWIAIFFSDKHAYRVRPDNPPVPDYIDWSHVHPDYKYMARDEDGWAYVYKDIPTVEDTNENGCWWGVGARTADVFSSYKRGDVHWTESLVRRGN